MHLIQYMFFTAALGASSCLYCLSPYELLPYQQKSGNDNLYQEKSLFTSLLETLSLLKEGQGGKAMLEHFTMAS